MLDESVRLWLQKADEDEASAKLLAEASLWGSACFHYQQAAEKRLKALAVHLGMAPRRSHNLAQLITEDGMPKADDEVLEAASSLTRHAWEGRYPGTIPLTEQDAEGAEESLTLLSAWVGQWLPLGAEGPERP